MIRLLLLWIITGTPVWLWGQEPLSLQQAQDLAMEHNFQVRIARAQVEMAANQVAPGAAGMLPSVGVQAGHNVSVQGFNQRFITGNEVVTTGANSNNSEVQALLGWTLFDGMAMFATLDRLRELEAMSRTALQASMLQVMAQVEVLYFMMVQQQMRQDVLQQNLSLSEQRMQAARDRYELGSGSKLDWLQAEVDYNTDRSGLLQAQLQWQETAYQLNLAVEAHPGQAWILTESIVRDGLQPLAELESAQMSNNPEWLMTRQQLLVAQLQQKEARAAQLPQVNLNANYRFNRSAAEAGFLLSSRTNGPGLGVALTMPLFQGGNIRRNIRAAAIQENLVQLQGDFVKAQLRTELFTAYRQYQVALEQIALERRNVGVARENYQVASDSYDMGAISALELRTAQQQQLLAQDRLLQALLQAQMAATDIYLLTGVR